VERAVPRYLEPEATTTLWSRRDRPARDTQRLLGDRFDDFVKGVAESA
jgi:hypothetical protein